MKFRGRILDSATDISLHPRHYGVDNKLADETDYTTDAQTALLACSMFSAQVVPVVNYAFFLQKGLFSKSSESLHGDWIHPKASDFHSSSLNVLAWMTDRVNASYL
jgi:hypothetical protein